MGVNGSSSTFTVVISLLSTHWHSFCYIVALLVYLPLSCIFNHMEPFHNANFVYRRWIF
jgi:hypothetical protein